MKTAKQHAALAISCAIMFGANATMANAQSVEQFYKGRQITMVVGTAPGGINDISARFVARHLGQFIPGNPSIVVENQPGAGGITSANRLANVFARDGSVIAKLERAVPLIAIQGNPNVQFDPLKLTWLGSLSSYAKDAYLMLIMATNPIQSVAELKEPGKSITLGGDNSASSNLIFASIAKEILGLNIKIVSGYTGAAPMFLAMQRGEIDGQVVGFSSVRTGQRDLWTHHAFRALAQFGRSNSARRLSRCPHRTRTHQGSQRAGAARFRRIAVLHLAAVRGAPWHTGRPRAGVANGVHGDVQGPGHARRCRKARHRHESHRWRGGLEVDRPRRRHPA